MNRNLGSGSYKQAIEHQRNKISYGALTDLFLTIVATVCFVVFITSRPFNSLVLYMLMNLVHIILIPFTFSLTKRNIHSQTISYYIVFLAMFLTLDCVSFVIRIAAFSFCESCTSATFLASTLIPFFIVILYIMLDIWMAYCAYSLRALAFVGEKGTSWQEADDVEAPMIYSPRQDAPQPPRQLSSSMCHADARQRSQPIMGAPVPPFTFTPQSQDYYGYPDEPPQMPPTIPRYNGYHYANFAADPYFGGAGGEPIPVYKR